MTLFTDTRLKTAGLAGGTLSRGFGNMADLKNQESVFREFSILPQHMLHFQQIHSDTILTVSNEADFQRAQTTLPQADGWVFSPALNERGAAILTADCTPLLVWNKDGSAWSLSHCGWRGVVQKLPFKTVETLKKSGAQGPFFAWAGPHIQACCFEVQADVLNQFSPACQVAKNGKTFIDLNTEIKAQLLQAGVAEKDIVFSPHCTCCEEKDFFSWRRDHVKNLLLSFVYKL